ncbi:MULTISPECIES: hypothetical protein [unclassified Clostridium]|uniref:hypothetical protein n=1 Tax=unclassified Clostridium TaxID=2614128 RepID=UPI00290F34BF|nr:hypothetical protein [Clostridium sp.]MDU5107565.1 hypothetical protein [Clostridium sp.]
MNINERLEEFLIKKPDGYRSDVKIFLDFLMSKNLPLCKEVLQGIRTKNVIESINYYKIKSNLASVSKAKRYASAISEFFKYLISHGYVENKEFYDELNLPTTINKSYLYKINEYISKDPDLKEKDTYKIYTSEEVRDLILKCDDVLGKDSNFIISKDKEYSKFIAALCLKLIALNGITYRELRKIKVTEDIAKYNKILINDFRLTLPEKYGQQLKKYIDIRNQILIKNSKVSDSLFINKKGDTLPVPTSNISWFLDVCTGRNDLNGLIKYAIKNMIIVGINDSVISRLTGASSILIQQAIYNEEDNDKLYWNKYLDSRNRNLELFDLI